MNVFDLYNSAPKITEACRLQRSVFKYWWCHNDDPIWGCMAADTETTGVTFHAPNYLMWGTTVIQLWQPFPFGISMCIPTNDELVLFWGRMGTELYEEMLKLLQYPGYKVFHNSRYDLRVLKHNNMRIANTIDCTLTMSRIGWDRRRNHDLKDLGEFICPQLAGWDAELKAVVKNNKSKWTRRRNKLGLPLIKNFANYSFAPDELVGKYKAQDMGGINDNVFLGFQKTRHAPKLIARMKQISGL